MSNNEVLAPEENIRPAAAQTPQGVIAFAEASKAVEEVRAAMMLAKNFPRDEILAEKKIAIACSRFAFASDAFYSYPRGKDTIVGETIYLLREIARCWGNISSGIKIIDINAQGATIEAFAHDLESNLRESITFKVEFKIKLSSGQMKFLTDPRDQYELMANYGARRLRACLDHILPPIVIATAAANCRRTLSEGGKSEPFIDRIKGLVLSFSSDLGVSKELIQERLGHKVEDMNEKEFVEFRGIYKSLKDGLTTRDDWFALTKKDTSNISSLNETLGITKKDDHGK